MRKNVIKGILYAIFPLFFNVIFFMLGGVHHPASVWLSYGWIHIAYIIMIATPLFARRTQSIMLFQFTTRGIAAVYFAIEFIIGLIFIFIGADGIKTPLMIQLIPLFLFLLLWLWNILYNEHTADNEERRAAEENFIKTVSLRTRLLMNQAPNGALKNKIEKVYDLIHSSPMHSDTATKDAEECILNLLMQLDLALKEDDESEIDSVVEKTKIKIEERNHIIMMLH